MRRDVSHLPFAVFVLPSRLCPSRAASFSRCFQPARRRKIGADSMSAQKPKNAPRRRIVPKFIGGSGTGPEPPPPPPSGGGVKGNAGRRASAPSGRAPPRVRGTSRTRHWKRGSGGSSLKDFQYPGPGGRQTAGRPLGRAKAGGEVAVHEKPVRQAQGEPRLPARAVFPGYRPAGLRGIARASPDFGSGTRRGEPERPLVHGQEGAGGMPPSMLARAKSSRKRPRQLRAAEGSTPGRAGRGKGFRGLGPSRRPI